MASNEEKKTEFYTCPYDGCTSSFQRLDRLDHHLCKHTGQRPYACKAVDCNKKYTCKEHLKRHVASVHCVGDEDSDDAVKFNCPQCKKELRTSQSLSRHLKRVHEQRIFKCNFCEKNFRKHQHLKVHEATHTGAKPFVCQVEGCGKAFPLPSKLKRHEKVHKGYQCDEVDCNKMFPSWSALRRHKIQHKPVIKCDQCDKVFNRPAHLKQHKASHTDVRNAFHCTYKDCSRYYFYKKNLDQHIKTYHLNERHPCTHEGCNKTFVNKVKLKHHLHLHEFPRPPSIRKKRELKKERKKLYRKSMATILTSYNPPKNDNVEESSNNLTVQNKEESLSKGDSDSIVINEINLLDNVVVNNETDTKNTNELGLSVEGAGDSNSSGLILSTISRHGLECASTANKPFEQNPNSQVELKT